MAPVHLFKQSSVEAWSTKALSSATPRFLWMRWGFWGVGAGRTRRADADFWTRALLAPAGAVVRHRGPESRSQMDEFVGRVRTECLFSCSQLPILALCKKKISHHIKLVVRAWNTKRRRNKKLIAQLGCTLRDECFEHN